MPQLHDKSGNIEILKTHTGRDYQILIIIIIIIKVLSSYGRVVGVDKISYRCRELQLLDYLKESVVGHVYEPFAAVYSNDLTLITHAKRILRWFELASGMKVNFHKSSGWHKPR